MIINGFIKNNLEIISECASGVTYNIVVLIIKVLMDVLCLASFVAS